MKATTRKRFHQARLVLWIAQVPLFAFLLWLHASDYVLLVYLGVISIVTGIEGPITSLEANTEDGA